MPKIGDALKRAVGEKPGKAADEGRSTRPTSALMNRNRRIIFQHLCKAPCSRLGPITRSVGMSRSSVKWHLDVLIESGYVLAYPVDDEPHYCPEGLIQARNLLLFSVLAGGNRMAVYTAVLATPGSDAGMIASSTGLSPSLVRGCLGQLMEIGRLTRTADGRYLRFFPTERYADAVAEDTAARKKFVSWLVRKLSSEHLDPNIEDLKGPETVITLRMHGEKYTLVIPNQTNII